MAVGSGTPYNIHIGNGVTTTFAYGFTLLNAADLVVTIDGVATSAYTVTGLGVAAGGTVVFGTAPANGAKVILQRVIQLVRATDYQDDGDLLADTLNEDFNRLWMAIQGVNIGDQRSLRAPFPEVLNDLPAAADRADKILTFDSAGQPILALPVAGTAGALAADLASTASATKGPGMVGYSGDLNYVGRTIGARLLDIGASPRSLGATGDGVADDTAYIVAALLYSKTLDLRNRKWKITSTVSLPAGCVVDMRGGAIVAATGATPLFSFTGAKEGLAILGGGSADSAGQVTGACSDFLFCEGATDTPTSAGQYARQIRIEGLHVTSTTITRFATFSKACRQIFMRGCMVYTPNGILFNGKNVEVMIADSIIYGATGAAGTYGIKTRSTGGTTYYNEGISTVNCTIDNFEITHDITDIFVYQVIGGYHGVAGALAATSGYVMQLQAPSTNLCEEIEVGGGAVFAGRSRFVGSGSGVAYHAKIDVHNINTPGTAWALENNASDIDINVVAKNALGGGGVGIVGTSNNSRITARGKFDSTYTNGIVLNGAAGADCVIGPVSGPTTGAIVGAARPVLLVGVPIHSASVASLVRTVSASNLAGSYAVGATIGTISWAFARGERGDIVVNLPYSGANAATQNVQISLPTGMVAESGSGWAATNLYVGAANGLLSVRIPYRCSQDGSGSISVVNQAGNTLTVTNQAYIGLFKDL